MGNPTWTRTTPTRLEYDPRSAVLLELRPNLVRIYATGGCSDQDPVLGPLAGLCPGLGAALEFPGLCPSLQLSAGEHHESGGEVQRLVVLYSALDVFFFIYIYIYIAYYILYI